MTSRLATIILTVGFFLTTCRVLPLAAETVSLEDALGQFDTSALTNLDLSALPALTDFSEAQLQSICRELQKQFQGEYVLELAPWREVANAALPFLDQHAETRPYAAWLRSRLDYLAVADQLKFTIPSPSLEVKPANPAWGARQDRIGRCGERGGALRVGGDGSISDGDGVLAGVHGADRVSRDQLESDVVVGFD